MPSESEVALSMVTEREKKVKDSQSNFNKKPRTRNKIPKFGKKVNTTQNQTKNTCYRERNLPT